MLLLVLCCLISACGSLRYYAQAVSGHMDLMSERVPITELLSDPATPEELKDRLRTVVAARAYAVSELGIPDNGSYTAYVDVDRPAVVWNVFATPEFSLEPEEWCFPVAGCVVYRGYFSADAAREYASQLAGGGRDVFVGAAAAYSTLGRFEDPVLSTMLVWNDARLAGILFHELAHQLVYVKDDSAFNEAFATAVEEAGVRRWLRTQGRDDALAAWLEERERTHAFELLLGRTRERLQRIYESDLDEADMRARKAETFDQLRSEYEALKKSWGGWNGYDGWFLLPINNARLVLSATYRELVPAFRALLRESEGDLPAFYTEARALAALPQPERGSRMRELLAVAGDPAFAAPR
jgi:predicted aminopeptidase